VTMSVNVFEFFSQVKKEISKITWPTKKETMNSVLVVLVFVVLSSLFFVFSDIAMAALVKFLLHVGS